MKALRSTSNGIKWMNMMAEMTRVSGVGPTPAAPDRVKKYK
jgi:hypothetical protein